ncbi:hypothetical protein AVEN_245893-1 [Araneus ventricosus]|uniref:Uncharacterized protein n=1 Tax=Araneus ventricosus TaxID=182803 RepID=A0A4Y2D464_ARAVE|nr:hypothetical protein AVEN_245893-1 [Araneus ventricosus]
MLVGRLSPRWSSPGLAPFLGRPGQCGYFCTTPAEGRLTLYVRFSVQKGQYTTDLQWESGFKPGNLRPQSRDLTTRSLRPRDFPELTFMIRYVGFYMGIAFYVSYAFPLKQGRLVHVYC